MCVCVYTQDRGNLSDSAMGDEEEDSEHTLIPSTQVNNNNNNNNNNNMNILYTPYRAVKWEGLVPGC